MKANILKWIKYILGFIALDILSGVLISLFVMHFVI